MDNPALTNPMGKSPSYINAQKLFLPLKGLKLKASPNLTASETQTQGQMPLTADFNRFGTVANANDTATMPLAYAGRTVTVVNSGAETLQIYPASGDNLGGGVDTATTISSGSRKTFACYTDGVWTDITGGSVSLSGALADIDGLTLEKGDLLVYDGSNIVELPVGSNTQVLSANSATATGLEWVAAGAGGGIDFGGSGGTENVFQIPDSSGDLVDSTLRQLAAGQTRLDFNGTHQLTTTMATNGVQWLAANTAQYRWMNVAGTLGLMYLHPVGAEVNWDSEVAGLLRIRAASGQSVALTDAGASSSNHFLASAAGNWLYAPLLHLPVTGGITASTTQTQGQGALTRSRNIVTTCANANDVVTLPPAAASVNTGLSCRIANHGAETLQIYPASGDAINGGSVDAAITLAAGESVELISVDATNWWRA